MLALMMPVLSLQSSSSAQGADVIPLPLSLPLSLPLPLRELLLVTIMTLLAVSVGVRASAADLAWSTELTADAAPEWTTTAAPEAKAPIRFDHGRLRVNIVPNQYANVSRTLDGIDGSDAKPLRVEASIAYDGPSPLLGQPAVIALQWAPRQIVAVGLAAPDPNNPNADALRRRGWAWWDDSRSRGVSTTPDCLTSDGGFIQTRILVTTKVVRAFVSSDGLSWKTLAVLERGEGRFVGAPKLVIIGRGVLANEQKTDATMGLTNGWGDAAWKDPAPFIFSGVRVTTEPPAAPVLPYAKGEDWDATWLTTILPGIPKQWEVLGPFGENPWPDFGRASVDGSYRGQDGKDLPWKAHTITEPTSQVIDLRSILASKGSLVWYLARTTLNVPKRGLWRLWTEASCRNTRMYVDGRLARDGGYRDSQLLVIDGGSAVLDLDAGPHRVVFGVLSHWDQYASLSFRAEPDDAAGRVAIAQRLSDDFPDEVDRGQERRFAIGGMWEAAGYPLLAVQAWSELSKQPNVPLELAARALGECARVQQDLRNRPAAEAAIQDLAQRRLQDADGPTAIAAHLSLARLWDQQAFPERADAEVDQALAVAGISIDQQVDLLLERARRHARAKDLKAVDADLTALLTRLPATHPERAVLMELALSARLNAGGDPTAIMTAVAREPGLTAQLNHRLAGLYGARDDARHGLAALQKWADGADPDPAPWTDADVVYAELLLTKANTLPVEQVDDAGYAEAAARYATALAKLPWRAHPLVAPYAALAQQARDKKSWADAVAKTRAAYFLATLLEFPAGAEMAASAAVVSKSPPAKPTAVAGGQGSMDGGWAVIGPFDNSDWKAYARTIVDPAHVDVQQPVEGVKWLKPGADAYIAAGGGIDFNHLFARDNSVCFAYRSYDVQEAGAGVITCGSDDALTLWVNGEKIHEDRDSRGVNPNSLRFEVKLKPGRNEVLARIQQGGGGWGFQLHLNTGAGNPLARHLSAMSAYPDSHAVLGQLFAALVGPLADQGQSDAALALARTIARCFPERFDAANGALERWITNPSALTDPTIAADLARWLDAALTRNDRTWNANDRMRAIDERRGRIGALAARAGDLELLRANGARRKASVGVGFDDRARWGGLVDIGNAWRLAGDLRRAMASFRQALDCGVDDDGMRNWLNQAVYWERRTLQGGRAAVLPDSDAGTQLASADRASASDPERALRVYQVALDAQSAQLVRPAAAAAAATTAENSPDAVAVDVFIGAAAYAAERIRALGDKGLAGYRALVDGRALDRMRSAQDANDLDALVRLAAIYAPSPVAAQALSQSANLAMEAGRPQQATDLLTRALLGLPVATPERPLLLAKLATVALAAGDAARARTALDRLGKDHGAATVTISGVPQPVATVVAGLRTQLEALRPAAPEGQPFASARRTNAVGFAPRPGSVAGIIHLPVPVADRAYDLRLAPTAWRHLPWLPIVADGVAYVNTLDEVLAIDLAAPAATALRWRSGPSRSARDEHFAGQIEQQPAVEGGLIAARVLLPNALVPSAPARFALEVRAVRDGRLRWSTATMPALATCSAVSSPALVHGSVYALFQDQADSNGARQLCAFDTTGALRWRTELPSGAGEIRAGDNRIACSEHAAAPTVDDGEVYVCGDGGTVAAFTTASGAVRWVAAYMRGYFDATDGRQVLRTLANRAASRVVVGADAVYVAPRDTLAVFALARANGASLWTRALSRTVAIAALDEGNNRAQLLLQDDGLNALDARTGASRWRWQPLGEALLTGISAVGGDTAYATTDRGLVRLRLIDGALLGSDTWTKLGLDGALGNLVLTPTAIVGTERGRVAWLKVGEPAANAAGVVPLVLDAKADATATTMLNPQVPSAPFGPPLMQRWKLPGTGLIGLFRPSDRADGDTYVAFADRLLRIDTGSGIVRWEAGLEPGVRTIELGPRAVVAVGSRSCAGYDPETGKVLWLRANVQDDAGWSFGKQPKEIWQPSVVSDGERVSFTHQDGRGVDVIDARTAKSIFRLRFPTGSRWIGVRGDEVIAVLQDDQRLWVQAQPLLGGAQTWYQELKTPDRNWGSSMPPLRSSDGTKLYLTSMRGVIALDLVAHKELFNDGTAVGDPMNAWIEQDQLYTIGKRDGGWQERILDPLNGAPRFAGTMLGGDNTHSAAVWRPAGDAVVHLNIQAPNDRTLAECRALSDGKPRWSTDIGNRSNRYLWDQRVIGGWMVVFSGQDNGRTASYQLLELATGRIVVDAPLPGGFGLDRRGDWPCLMIGDTFVYAGTDGVYAFGGAAPAAAQTAMKAPTEAGSWLADALAPTPRVAFATRVPLTADSDAGWASTAEIALDQPGDWRPLAAATAEGRRAAVRCAWNRAGLGVLVTVTDAHAQPSARGAAWDDGDSVTIGIDPDASGPGRQDPSQPLVFQLATVAGETRLLQRAGRTPEADDERPQAVVVRTAAGLTYRLVVPWAALRPNAGERPGARPQLRLGVLVSDGQSGALELGHGLARGLDARSFVALTAVDLTPERIAGFGRFAQLLPTHPLTWQLLKNQLLAYPGAAGARERDRIYSDFLRANPGSENATIAILALADALREAGESDPLAVAAARAQAAKVPMRVIGDALGREHAGGEGRVITQWVFIDPAKPTRALMLQFYDGSWEHRAYWGENAMPWGTEGTASRRRLGDLPPAGQWVQLTVPIGLIGLLGKSVESISWSQCDGAVTWDLCELVDGQRATILIDEDLPKNRKFTNGGWVDAPTKSGKQAWSMGKPSGLVEMHFDGGQVLFDTKAGATTAPAVTRAVLLEAAGAIVDEPEVLTVLREAETGGDAVVMYLDFLRAHAHSPNAAVLLNRMRELTEDGKPERRPAAIAAGEALMAELNIPRDQRRSYYREVTPSLSAWWLCGWFDGGLDSSNLLITLPPEQSAFDPKQTFTIGGAGAGWKPISGEWWGIEPRKSVNPASHSGVCYVATTVDAPRQLDANVFIGVRGWAQLWLNGVRVGPNLGVGNGPLERDHDVLPVTLRKGRNDLMVKLLWDEAQVSLRLADANGRPIEGLVLPRPRAPATAGSAATTVRRTLRHPEAPPPPERPNGAC